MRLRHCGRASRAPRETRWAWLGAAGLLAILLPRFGAAGGAIAPIAIATALALLVPVSIAGLRPLSLRCAPAPRMAFACHRGGGIFRGKPCASSFRALALRRLRGHSHQRCYAKAGLDRGKARRDAAAAADGPLRRDLEKPRLVPLRRRLASCGSSAGKSRVDAPHGACRSGGSCYRTRGLQGMRGLRLHARALCYGSRLRLDGASLASPVRGKSLSAAASAPCGPGRRRSSSCFAFGHAGNAKGGAGRACARALQGKPFRPARW